MKELKELVREFLKNLAWLERRKEEFENLTIQDQEFKDFVNSRIEPFSPYDILEEGYSLEGLMEVYKEFGKERIEEEELELEELERKIKEIIN